MLKYGLLDDEHDLEATLAMVKEHQTKEAIDAAFGFVGAETRGAPTLNADCETCGGEQYKQDKHKHAYDHSVCDDGKHAKCPENWDKAVCDDKKKKQKQDDASEESEKSEEASSEEDGQQQQQQKQRQQQQQQQQRQPALEEEQVVLPAGETSDTFVKYLADAIAANRVFEAMITKDGLNSLKLRAQPTKSRMKTIEVSLGHASFSPVAVFTLNPVSGLVDADEEAVVALAKSVDVDARASLRDVLHTISVRAEAALNLSRTH